MRAFICESWTLQLGSAGECVNAFEKLKAPDVCGVDENGVLPHPEFELLERTTQVCTSCTCADHLNGSCME